MTLRAKLVDAFGDSDDVVPTQRAVDALADIAIATVREWLLSEIPDYERMTAGYEVVVALGRLVHEAGRIERWEVL